MSIFSNEMEKLLAGGSAVRAMFEEGKRLAKEFGPENVFDFSLGNPFAPTPFEFDRAVKAVIDENNGDLHAYMSNAGHEDTRAAVAENLNKRFAADFTFSNIVMTVGAANALVCVMKALINPGDEVIVFAPYFLEYGNYAANFGGKVVPVSANPPSFIPKMDELSGKINEKTKAVIINNPNNPTGIIYSEETIAEISEVLRKAENRIGHPIFLVTDEPYRELAYDGIHVPFVSKFYDNTIICYSFSKSLSLPGERIGYVAILPAAFECEKLCEAVAIAVRVTGCVNAPSIQQKALISVLDKTADVSLYDKNRRLLLDILDSAGAEHAKCQGAFYAFVKTPIPDDKEFAAFAKEKYHVLMTPGSSFECTGYVRIAYCVPYERIERARAALLELFRIKVES